MNAQRLCSKNPDSSEMESGQAERPPDESGNYTKDTVGNNNPPFRESEGCALLKWVTPKRFIFIFTFLLLTCSLQGISYGQTLTASTSEVLTEANSNNFVVTLLLESTTWADIYNIRDAVEVSGIDGVTIQEETYESDSRWVCTSNCGNFVEWGYWEAVYSQRPRVRRISDTALEVVLTIDSNNFDFDTDATLAFTVEAAAINDYSGASLTATISVTTAVSASAMLPLTEATLDGGVVTLTLTGATYEQNLSRIRDAVTVSGITGVTVNTAKVQRVNDTEITVELNFDVTDFDTDTTLIFNVGAGAITDDTEDSLTAAISVSAAKESVAASVVSPLTEVTLHESMVTLTLTGATYEQNLSRIRNAVTVSGITGVTVNTAKVQRVNDTEITVELNFDGTDFASDRSLTFSVAADALTNYKGTALTAEIPVTASRGESLLTIFWTDSSPGKIRRANLDGSNIEDLVTLQRRNNSPEGIALDVAGGKMYWTVSHFHSGSKIQRANLDGSNVEDLVTQGLRYPEGIALDVAGGKMYWTDSSPGKIQCANLDGSNVQDLVTHAQGLDGPEGIALDVAGGKMYWTDYDTDKIQRANLDGSNIEDLVTQGLNSPNSIALDVAGGKMYWPDWGTDKIQRANLDGSNVQDLVTHAQGLDGPVGIALDVAGGKMYWITDWDTDNEIQRANLDGSNIEDLITLGYSFPGGIALGILSPVNPAIVKEDVNLDGVVDTNDLVYISQRYGRTGQIPGDVNDDGVINIDDLIAVAAVIDSAPAAPAAHSRIPKDLTAATVDQWLIEAKLTGKKRRPTSVGYSRWNSSWQP